MRKVLLYGELGDKYGKEFDMEIKTLRQALSLLSANFKDFKKHLIDSDTRLAGYEVWCGDRNIEGKEEDFIMQGEGDIKIIPVVKGAGAAVRIVIGIILVVVGTCTSWLGGLGVPVAMMGASMIVGGVAELLTKKPKTTTDSTDSTDTSSYMFSGDDNAVKQGNAIPVGYGKFLVGSNVISQEVTISEIPV